MSPGITSHSYSHSFIVMEIAEFLEERSYLGHENSILGATSGVISWHFHEDLLCLLG